MSSLSENAKAIFLQAVEEHTPESWADLLDQACGDDEQLRGHVEGLLQAHTERDSLFDRIEATRDFEPTLRAGETIGPYKIREQIGDGGMGVVYVAEQEKPLRRKVALKLIKPGMDSKAVLARFEAERNALALMNHPHIAKVLDAGTTASSDGGFPGRPYFAMELIQGQPITEYCDRKRLTIKERLKLFTKICDAVQHAHQKGVIHRDIKPTNILVTEIDGKPVPKVIDFGVAKALGANLTDRTVYTNFQAVIGTPLYMSPEQTQLSGVDVDTSSDVYALGILLYELLTGTTPLSPDDLKQAAQDEVLRRIRETVPPRPSNRISSLGKDSPAISECRSAPPDQLGRLVRGDLDWIVMKALEKDRDRRYKTADALANDVERHLENEPVEARPPSTMYRLSRFYRRNRVLVGVAAVVLVSTALAASITTYAMLDAQKQRDALEQTNMELGDSLDQSYRLAREILISRAMEGSEANLEKSLAKQILTSPRSNKTESESDTRLINALDAYTNGDFEKATELLLAITETDENNQVARSLLAKACIHAGKDELFALQLPELRNWEPETSLERLAKAAALVYEDPDESIRLVESTRDSHTILKLLLHTEARLAKAMWSHDLQLLQDVDTSFQNIELAMGDNSNVRNQRLLALTLAYRLASRLGDSALAEKCLITGEKVADRIELEPRNAGDLFVLWLFYLAKRNEESAWQVVSRIDPNAGSYVVFPCIDRIQNAPSMEMALEQFESTMKRAEASENPWYDISVGYMSFESGKVSNRVVELCGVEQNPMVRRHAIYSVFLAGDGERGQLLAEDLLQSTQKSGQAAAGDLQVVGFLALQGLPSNQEIDSFMKANSANQWTKCRAHFVVALKHMGAGQIEGAKKHFGLAAKCDALGFDAQLAQAISTRLEK